MTRKPTEFDDAIGPLLDISGLEKPEPGFTTWERAGVAASIVGPIAAVIAIVQFGTGFFSDPDATTMEGVVFSALLAVVALAMLAALAIFLNIRTNRQYFARATKRFWLPQMPGPFSSTGAMPIMP